MATHLPAIARLPLPLRPLEFLLQKAANRLVADRPGVFERISEYYACRYEIDPVDVNWTAVLTFGRGKPRVELVWDWAPRPRADAIIRGPFLVLVDLLDGTLDGDAMFFSRDLVIEGDMEAVLALRNALDDADLNLVDLCADLAGPMRGPAQLAATRALEWLRGRANSNSAPAITGPAHPG